MGRRIAVYYFLTSTLLPTSYASSMQFLSEYIQPYGYVELNALTDTRQVVGERDNDTMFWPAKYVPDVGNRDINQHGEYAMYDIDTRLGARFTLPSSCSTVKYKGDIETDFFGSPTTIGCVRLRYAYGQVDFTRTKSIVLFGQFRHPLWQVEYFPQTISSNSGSPINFQVRNPQVRYVQAFGAWECMVTALSERNIKSLGPLGASTTYFRNGRMPELNAQLRYYYRPEYHDALGIAVDIKRIAPRLVSDKNIKVNEFVTSFIGSFYGRITNQRAGLRFSAFYAQNGAALNLISGYGVRTLDPTTDKRTYSPTGAVSGWLDGSYIVKPDRLEIGLFAGVIYNVGSPHLLYDDPTTKQPIIYALDPSLAYVAKCMPRLVISADPVRIGLELTYAQAGFGRINRYGRIDKPHAVHDVRILAAFFYVF